MLANLGTAFLVGSCNKLLGPEKEKKKRKEKNKLSNNLSKIHKTGDLSFYLFKYAHGHYSNFLGSLLLILLQYQDIKASKNH